MIPKGRSPQSIPVTVSYDMTTVKKAIYHGFLNVNDPSPWPSAASEVDKGTHTYASVKPPTTATTPSPPPPPSKGSIIGTALTVTQGYGWDAHPIG